MPQQPEDLDKHRLIVYGEDARPPVQNVNWLLDAGVAARSGAQADSQRQQLLRHAARGRERPRDRRHCRISWRSKHTDLVRVLPELTGPPIEAYFVYPEELRTSKRISVFRDFLLRKVAESRLG